MNVGLDGGAQDQPNELYSAFTLCCILPMVKGLGKYIVWLKAITFYTPSEN